MKYFYVKNSRALTVLGILLMTLSGCMTNGAKTPTKTNLTGNNVVLTEPNTTTSKMDLQAIQKPVAGTTTTAPLRFSLQLTSSSGVSLSNFCKLGSSSLTCSCYYSWTNAGFSGSSLRSDQKPVSLIQDNNVMCDVPDAYSSTADLPDNTLITVTLKNSSGVLVASGNYLKGSESRQGSVVTSTGITLNNISHYACYEKFMRPTQIVNVLGSATDSGTSSTVYFPYSNNFCYYSMNTKTLIGAANGSSSCSNGLNATGEYSTQSFYYNLYTDNPSLFYSSNSRFFCPMTPSGSGASASDTAYPMDSTFALAQTPNATFNLGISSRSVLGKNSDPNTAQKSCASTTSNTDNTADYDNIISYQCMGYAIQPDSVTGSCPTLKKSTGEDIPTYRLRKYYALYPPTYDTNGAVVAQPTAMDVTYILDRPLSNGKTVLGPKPCPFAYYDRKGVVNPNSKKYYGTNNPGWAGKNLDGTQLPNQDAFNASSNTYSCSATLPISVTRRTPGVDSDAMYFGTVNAQNNDPKMRQLYIRPVQPWAPHYVEDTDFRACAPKSFAPKEPPIYFAEFVQNGKTQRAWCSAPYPTDTWSGTTPSPTDSERPAGFQIRAITGDHPSVFSDPPLLAPKSDIYRALLTHPSYRCSWSQEGATQGQEAKCGCTQSFTSTESVTLNGTTLSTGYLEEVVNGCR